MSKLIEINDNNFQQEVLESDLPVIVDLSATWCGPCHKLTPILEKLASAHDFFKIVKIDIDDSPKTTSKFNVRSVPTLLFFKDGKECKRFLGVQPETVILAAVNSI